MVVEVVEWLWGGGGGGRGGVVVVACTPALVVRSVSS